jgi:hypothetical protein
VALYFSSSSRETIVVMNGSAGSGRTAVCAEPEAGTANTAAAAHAAAMSDVERTKFLVGDMFPDLRQSPGMRQEREAGGFRPDVHDCTLLLANDMRFNPTNEKALLSTYTDPLTLFAAVVNMLNAEDWPGVARLCDPVSLSSFKRGLMDNLAPPSPQSQKLTATELMKAVPNMPRAVAEYQVTRFRESLDPKHRMREQVPSIKSREALQSLDVAGVFAAWLEGKSLRRQVERDVELKRMTRAMANEIQAQGIKPFNFKALGYLADGQRIAHIIYRRDDVARGPFPPIADLREAGCTAPEIDLMRDAWGREHPLTVMARLQKDDSWLLVADADFLLVSQIGLGFSQTPEI